ncbi:DUF4142 domain-containing protein [Sphingomonas abietis]|uniref:DUF4142 domain-containing protein n=1 Tax=Sphingomonas abietis TaxID=3012344 RepID=A0ABY7NUF7_9SPHN|nr:DUF4142 domain-containing protein [Sphingomonas abietis]WBO24268.1 DUF4142 domain-containing protein [Sphingomonas abietis]
MNKYLCAAALFLGTAGIAAQAGAQTATMDVSPIPSQSGPNFVNAASDVDVYQMKAAQLAVYKAQRDDVKAYAKGVFDAADTRHKALLASLHNDQRTIKTPTTMPSADRAAMLKLLSKSPRGSFDNLYLQQSVKIAKAGWSVSKGYALDGTDDSLKQVATTAAPSFEQEVTQATSLLPAALVGAQ